MKSEPKEDDFLNKEDDMIEKEDDTRVTRSRPKEDDLKETSLKRRKVTQQHQTIAEVGHPPPPHSGVVEKPLPTRGDCNVSKSCTGNTAPEKPFNENVNNINIRSVKPSHITVNGVKLVDLQCKRQEDNDRKRAEKKIQVSGSKKRSKKTTPSSGQKENLLNYVVKKKMTDSKEDNTNITSETFRRKEDNVTVQKVDNISPITV